MPNKRFITRVGSAPGASCVIDSADDIRTTAGDYFGRTLASGSPGRSPLSSLAHTISAMCVPTSANVNHTRQKGARPIHATVGGDISVRRLISAHKQQPRAGLYAPPSRSIRAPRAGLYAPPTAPLSSRYRAALPRITTRLYLAPLVVYCVTSAARRLHNALPIRSRYSVSCGAYPLQRQVEITSLKELRVFRRGS